jgi:glycosyltransferase involved in cell wall biosynthesis
LLGDLGLFHMEVHHFLGLPPQAIELVAALGVPYDVFIHDYLWVCPRVTLIGGDGRYCGEPPVAECESCIRLHGGALEESLTVEGLRVRSARILRGANRVIAPSQDARDRMARYFPGVAIELLPWEPPVQSVRRATTAPEGCLRVAVIGAIGIQKGHQVLLECARDAARRNLSLEFVVIGYTLDDEPLLATGKVFVTGPYKEGEVDRLLDRERCSAAFFPSLWPETWCYSLTYALSHNLPVVAFDHGALAERLRTYDPVELLPLSASAESINDSLIQLVKRTASSQMQKEAAMDSSTATTDQPLSEQLSSTVQILTLPEGVYSFAVQGGAGPDNSPQRFVLPALQVSLAPARSAGNVDFLTGASALDRWLAYDTDMLVVRISGGDASLLLNSVRLPDSPVLAVDIKRLNAEPSSTAAEAIAAEAGDGSSSAYPQVRLLTHVKNVGDLDFHDCWAGWPGQRLWIEAFSVSLAGLPSGDSLDPNAALEYRGVTAEGFETAWLTSQELCGSRGAGVPLLGFAVRLTPEAAERFDCAYSGRFFSGATVGPFTDGDLCRSEVPDDPLEAIEVRVTERRPVGAPAEEIAQPYSVEA